MPRRRKAATGAARKKRVHPNWPVGEAKMAIIPVTAEGLQHWGRVIRSLGRSKVMWGTRGVRKRYYAVLLRKTGPTSFEVVKQFLAPYDSARFDARTRAALAKEFGLSKPPETLPSVRHEHVEGLKIK